ncbi:MAG TPA: cell division protein ZapC, partial [Parvularcula sp.]|nr:cell division protein ZapC [Parvularcula sp.]
LSRRRNRRRHPRRPRRNRCPRLRRKYRRRHPRPRLCGVFRTSPTARPPERSAPARPQSR